MFFVLFLIWTNFVFKIKDNILKPTKTTTKIVNSYESKLKLIKLNKIIIELCSREHLNYYLFGVRNKLMFQNYSTSELHLYGNIKFVLVPKLISEKFFRCEMKVQKIQQQKWSHWALHKSQDVNVCLTCGFLVIICYFSYRF